MNTKNLLLFNLRTDADDSILGFTTDWINALSTQFNKIIVITMFAGRIAVPNNVEVYSVGREKGYSEIHRFFLFYVNLLRILRKNRIDACFAHMIPLFAVMAWPILRIKRIPILLWYAHKSVTTLLRISTFMVDRVVASTKSGFNINTSKLFIIGQGIDTNRFQKDRKLHNTDRAFTIIVVGRISPVKRIEILIHALKKMNSYYEKPKISTYIIGGPMSSSDEKYENNLKKMINQFDLADQITFVGPKKHFQVHEYYQKADCYVNSGDTDSVDKTVLEAMSCEIPIITSNIAFYDILDSELAKKWIIPKNDVNELFKKLALLINMSSSERDLLGESLRQIVLQNHSLASLSEKIKTHIYDFIESSLISGDN